jgi:uncharacterized protein (DUF4415 family)
VTTWPTDRADRAIHVMPPRPPSRRRRPSRPSIPLAKEQVTLRIDSDVLDFFQKDGPGWQDRINAALRKAAGK